jgi:hypothetical protein
MKNDSPLHFFENNARRGNGDYIDRNILVSNPSASAADNTAEIATTATNAAALVRHTDIAPQ